MCKRLVFLIFVACGTVVAEADDTIEQLLNQTQRAMQAGKPAEAERLVTQVLERDPKQAVAYYLRGRLRFRLGKLKASVTDFDQYIKLRPDQASRQWERGIALYYAEDFKRGAQQFELYQTFHDNDVENSVWRYLCVARTDGVAKARQTILPIKDDRRIPMMQVFDMFRGKSTPQQVLDKAREGAPGKERLAYQLFYAQLYVGLYYEAQGQHRLARKFILKAADDHKSTRGINRYMWEVARIHAELIRARGERPPEPRAKAGRKSPPARK